MDFILCTNVLWEIGLHAFHAGQQVPAVMLQLVHNMVPLADGANRSRYRHAINDVLWYTKGRPLVSALATTSRSELQRSCVCRQTLP